MKSTRDLLVTILTDGHNMTLSAISTMLEHVTAADLLSLLDPMELDQLMGIWRSSSKALSSNPPPETL